MQTYSRRWFFQLVGASTLGAQRLFGALPAKTGLASSPVAALPARPDSLASLRDERRKMAQRRRRMIFNDDGDDIGGEGSDTPTGLLKVRTSALVGSQVDAVFYCPRPLKLSFQDGPYAKRFGRSWFWNDQMTTTMRGNMLKMLEHFGQDPLDAMINFCRHHGLECFFSARMNDIHAAFFPQLAYNIELKHPEYLLGTPEWGEKYTFMTSPLKSRWVALNYELSEVRQRTVAALREVGQNYDIDGIELDFLRVPIYFRSTMEGRAATAQQTSLMTEMLRSIRQMTEEVGMKRGRPILVATRCEADLALSRSVGLDAEAWLKEGLVDIVIAGRYVFMTVPMKPIIDLAHRYNAPAYAQVLESDYKGWSYEDPEMYRGDAMARYLEGADGVYAFNLFNPLSPMWRELGDPKQLAKMNRSYDWDYLPPRAGSLLWDFVSDKSGRLRPNVPVTTGSPEAIPLMVGEDLTVAAECSRKCLLTLRVHIARVSNAEGIIVRLNGTNLESPRVCPVFGEQRGGLWLDFSPKPSFFRAGENSIEVSLTKPLTNAATVPEVDRVRLDVDYATSPYR